MNARVPRRLLTVWFAAACVMTLFPFGPLRIPGRPFAQGGMHGFDPILNVAFFVPGGVLLVACGLTAGTAIAVAAFFSQFIETLQIWIPGRYPTLMDVGMNALGTGLGALLAPWVVRGARMLPGRAAMVLGAAAAAATIAWMDYRFAPVYGFAAALVLSLAASSALRPRGACFFSLAALPVVAFGFANPLHPTALPLYMLGAALGAWPAEPEAARPAVDGLMG